ncbi:hypothetical protein Tco_0862598 [Tanacetum coccineum]
MVEVGEAKTLEDEETMYHDPKIALSAVLFPNILYEESKNRSKLSTSNAETDIQAEETLAHQLLCNLTRYSEEMHIREVQITMLQRGVEGVGEKFGVDEVPREKLGVDEAPEELIS